MKIKTGEHRFIHTAIDCGGMSVIAVSDPDQADNFETEEDAKSFITRLTERYPFATFEVVH